MKIVTATPSNPRWKFKLDYQLSLDLRMLIMCGDIEKCCSKLSEITNALSEKFEQFDELKFEFAELSKLITKPEEFKQLYGSTPEAEVLDERLSTFYDICDELRIWISI